MMYPHSLSVASLPVPGICYCQIIPGDRNGLNPMGFWGSPVRNRDFYRSVEQAFECPTEAPVRHGSLQ